MVFKKTLHKTSGQHRKRINPIKTTNNDVIFDEDSGLQDMQRDMAAFFQLLVTDNKTFNPEKAFKSLVQYIILHERILYSTVSNIVYVITDEDDLDKKFGTLLSNIEKLVDYANNDKNIETHKNALSSHDKKHYINDTKKAVWKIWDHVNLAHRQYNVLKQSDTEYDEKFEKRIEKFQNKITSEINAQLLTVVGIFTALAFILFGGISSLQSILSEFNENHILKLLILGCTWGLGMLNVIFVFLFCVSKMTMLNFKLSMSPSASFWQRYPVICWSNFLLTSLIIILSWLYYCISHNVFLWLNELVANYPKITSISTLIFISFLIIKGSSILIKKTAADIGDEDE